METAGLPSGRPRRPPRPVDDRTAAVFITLGVSVVVALLTTLTFYWIRELALGDELRAKRAVDTALASAQYYPGQAAQPAEGKLGFGAALNLQKITQAEANFPNDPVRSWLGNEAWQYAQGQAGQYVVKYPQPQNVQILTGMTTQQIWNYMQTHVSGALGVSCQYCHNLAPVQGDPAYQAANGQAIANFGQETDYTQYNKKVSARRMLQLVIDLNNQWVANGALVGWKANYVNCATCHNGQAVGMAAYPPQFFQLIPKHNNIDYKEAVNDEIIYDYEVAQQDKPIAERPEVPVGQGELSLTYDGGPTQDAVWLNQYSMYTMAWSLGVGCNYCHNSRNFVSYELVQKVKAQRMLLMTTWLKANWDQYGAQQGADGQLNVPGCYTCHQGRGVPASAINQGYLNGLAPDQQQVALPEVLRGLPTTASGGLK